MRQYIKIFLLASVLLACDEATVLDLKQTPSRIVIEGLVTNKHNYQSVKVTRSAEFYGSGKTPRITDAVVTVSDDTGLEFNFVHNPRNHPDSTGIYIPEGNFVGAIGRTYSLRVDINGDIYEARDKMLSVTAIDSLTFRINADQQADPNEPGKIYEMLLFAKEPQDEDNFYLFKYYRNDSLTFFNYTDIYFSDDELLGENIAGIPSPVYFAQDDKARLEVYSLSRQGYIFYNDLSTTLNNDGGGMFGPIPAPPRSNLSNDALGFFQVSAIQEKESYIE